MNYNDSILENKPLNFFKELLFNIMVAVLIVLVFAVVMVLGFKFKPYEVLSDSQYPIYKKGDMVVVKEQANYIVGDILKYDDNGTPTTHRLIWKGKDSSGKVHYICHGDNVQSVQPGETGVLPVEQEIDFVSQFETLEQLNANIKGNVQDVSFGEIEGKVVAVFKNYGTYFNFIKEYKEMLICLVLGVWCLSYTLQVQNEISKARRLL